MQTPLHLNAAFTTAHDALEIRLLTAADWQAFRCWAKHICTSHGHGPDMMARIDATPDVTWQAELAQTNWKFFAVHDAGEIVSLGRVGSISTYPNSLEVILEVAKNYQGHGIGTRLYKAMRDYIAVNAPQSDMVARIQPANAASRRSAEKAGLVYSGYTEPSIHGQPGYMLYKIAAKDLRGVAPFPG